MPEAKPREMQTSIWGSPMWTAIHLVSFNYPVHPTEAQKRDYSRWLALTGKVLPCIEARRKFETHVWRALPQRSKHNIDRKVTDSNHIDKWLILSGVMNSRYRFSHFCYRLHREVNETLERDTPHDYLSVCDMYEGYRAGCLTSKQKKENAQLGHENGCTEAKSGRKKVKSALKMVKTRSASAWRQCAPAVITQDACKADVEFGVEDYRSPDGMQTAMWGCVMWTVIHAVSFSIPKKPTSTQVEYYVKWLLSISKVLPCGYCRINFYANLCTAAKNLHIDVSLKPNWPKILAEFVSNSKQDEPLGRLCYELHSAVNKMLGKTVTDIKRFSHLKERFNLFMVGKPPRQMKVVVCPRSSTLRSFAVS